PRRSSAVTGPPFQRISPPLSARTPMIMRMVVVFPAPFPPTKPVIRPSSTRNDTWSTAQWSPKRRTTLSSSSIVRCPPVSRGSGAGPGGAARSGQGVGGRGPVVGEARRAAGALGCGGQPGAVPAPLVGLVHLQVLVARRDDLHGAPTHRGHGGRQPGREVDDVRVGSVGEQRGGDPVGGHLGGGHRSRGGHEAAGPVPHGTAGPRGEHVP